MLYVICTECYRTVETVRTCNDAYSKTNRSEINLYTINVVQIVRNGAAIVLKFTLCTIIPVERMGIKATWHNGKVKNHKFVATTDSGVQGQVLKNFPFNSTLG